MFPIINKNDYLSIMRNILFEISVKQAHVC
jgi:hypothetical protein